MLFHWHAYKAELPTDHFVVAYLLSIIRFVFKKTCLIFSIKEEKNKKEEGNMKNNKTPKK